MNSGVSEAIFRAGFAAFVGRPNVGKSSLLNRFVGQKLAITSHKPQTTRHRILGVKTSESAQILFLDTPGLHNRGDGALNRYLNRTAQTTLQDVDVLLFTVEAGRWMNEDDLALQQATMVKSPIIAVINKIDLLQAKEALLPFIAQLSKKTDFAAVVPVSAEKGINLDILEAEIAQFLPQNEAIVPEDYLSDRPERFFVAELVREQLTRRYHQEIPYQLTVEIERFEEEDKRIRISALIWVERENQKAILIGNKGSGLKAVGTKARKEISDFLGSRVHLELWVKVRESWSSKEAGLAALGYSMDDDFA